MRDTRTVTNPRLAIMFVVVRQPMQTTAAALAGMLVLAPLPAGADEIGDAFLGAERMLEAGDANAVWNAFDRATELFWAAAPLGFAEIALAENVAGYGDFTPRADNRFSPGDELILYIAPVGYGWTAIGDEYRIRFRLDLEIASTTRGVVVDEEGFATVERLTRTRGREFQATVSLTVPQLPADDYEIRISFHDAATGKEAVAVIAFVVE